MKNRLLIILVAVALMNSCLKDKPAQASGGKTEREVEITFLSSASTRATTEGIPDEKVVETLDLLVFDASGFSLWRSAYKVGDRFRVTLPVSEHIDVYFVANCRSIIESLYAEGRLASKAAWENIRMLLVDKDPARLVVSSGFEYLPMWGQLLDQTVVDVPVNRWSDVHLLRAVASVDVYVNEMIGNFTMSDLRLYFVPDRGFIAPSAANYDDAAHSVREAASPVDMLTTETLFSNRYDVANRSIANKLYLYDNDTDETTVAPSPALRRYTRLVAGGVYEGATYYYPIDFAAPDGNGLGRIVRNRKYVFIINGVSSRGYDDPETASTEPMVGLNVNIVDWDMDDAGDFWVSGSYFLGLERRVSYLTRQAGSEDLLPMRTNMPAEVVALEFDNSGNGTAGPSGTANEGISNSRFRVEKITGADGHLTALQVTSLGAYDPDTASRNTDAVVLTAGRIRVWITIIQQSGDTVDWQWGGNIGDEGGLELGR